MRERENVVEAALLILWDYWFKPAVFWYTYPFLRTVLPWWLREWEKYRRATLHERERKAREEQAGAVDLEAGPIVVQSTEGRYQELPDQWTTQRPKPRVKVRRHPPIHPGSAFRYVSYTHEDGKVDWGIEQIPGVETPVGWLGPMEGRLDGS